MKEHYIQLLLFTYDVNSKSTLFMLNPATERALPTASI